MKKLILLIGLLGLLISSYGQLQVPAIASSGQSGSASSLLTGLLGYWDLDEVSGNTLDATDNNYDGTVYGATQNYTPALLGTCYDFDGSADSIAFGAILDGFTDSISISGWINSDSYDGYIASNYIGNPSYQGYYLGLNNNSPGYARFRIYTSGADVTVDGVTAIYNAWHHVVGIYDSDSVKIYIDGVRDNATVYTTSMTFTSANRFLLGAIPTTSLNGQIDEVGIWNRVLTPAEITELYNSGTGITYPFE